MNTKVVVTGLAALALVVGTYAYREPLTSAVTGLFKGKTETAARRSASAPATASSGPASSSTASGGRKGRRGSAGGAVTVSVAKAEVRSVPQLLNAIGSVQPIATVGVKTRVDGQLQQSFFQEGQMVKKGQRLFRIDPRPFEVTLRQTQANLARDKAQFEKTKSELARYEELVSMGYASRQKYEDVRASNAAAMAVIAASEAAVDQARLQLDFTTITAPIDGRTGNLLVSVGNQVRANDQTPLVTITQIKPIYVSFSVPERFLLPLKALMAQQTVPVEAMLTGEVAAKQSGKLTFVNNVVDVATGTIQLKAIFPNEDESLTPGAFVNLSLVIRDRPDAIVVPTGAMQIGQSGTFVWVAREDNTAEVRPVKVDETTQFFTVISSGLKAGETVITDGQINLVPNGRIRIREAANGGGTGGTEGSGAAEAPAGAATGGDPATGAARQRGGNGS